MAALRRFYRLLSWRELPGGASLGPGTASRNG